MNKKIARKSLRLAPVLLSLALCFTLLPGCSLYYLMTDARFDYELDSYDEFSEDEYASSEFAEPDNYGSWGQISEPVVRAENWQLFVHNSPFKLGEPFPYNSPYEEEEYMESKSFVVNYGSYPSLDGSTVVVPMAAEFARQHLGFNDPDANDFASFSTTASAYRNLILKTPNNKTNIESKLILDHESHPVDLVIATEPSKRELKLAKERGVAMVTKPVCYDAFVFITHKDNPVDSLTLDEVRGIYSGKITNWKELGGEDKKILAYQREAGSGSQTGMVNLVMGDLPFADSETVKTVEGMSGLVKVVTTYKNEATSIGYTYKYYIDNLFKNDDLKVIAVESVAPTSENIRAQEYSLAVNYYGVIRGGEETAVGGRFLDWMLSEEGQRSIKQAGYIPLTDYDAK
ncbi:MAG: substrate-binding domain-containing protein [Coriobacteriales bacterium]|jgi:phosphate transport system substrate-binding protein|nr:substrate-binding domain-containing protein [Coriobacteriales bacterium]